MESYPECKGSGVHCLVMNVQVGEEGWTQTCVCELVKMDLFGVRKRDFPQKFTRTYPTSSKEQYHPYFGGWVGQYKGEPHILFSAHPDFCKAVAYNKNSEYEPSEEDFFSVKHEEVDVGCWSSICLGRGYDISEHVRRCECDNGRITDSWEEKVLISDLSTDCMYSINYTACLRVPSSSEDAVVGHMISCCGVKENYEVVTDTYDDETTNFAYKCPPLWLLYPERTGETQIVSEENTGIYIYFDKYDKYAGVVGLVEAWYLSLAFLDCDENSIPIVDGLVNFPWRLMGCIVNAIRDIPAMMSNVA